VPLRLFAHVPTAGGTPVEILLRGGRTVRVAARFDAQTLPRVPKISEDARHPCIRAIPSWRALLE
jgi:hypothetical protein